jgi:endonuclease G
MLSILSILYVSTSLATAPITIPNACPANLPFGNPEISEVTIDICHTGYYSAYSEEYKLPLFVAWPLTAEHSMGCIGRVGNFQHDPLANGKDADPTDYSRSGFDKGHLADDGDFGWDETESRESFYMTNMTPQFPNLNRGLWKVVETKSRAWATDRGEVIIYAGPIVDSSDNKLPNNVDIPSRFWKVVYDPKANEAATFIMPNQKINTGKLSDLVASVAEVEQAAGITIPLPATYDKTQPTDLDKWLVNLSKWNHDKQVHCASNINQ